MTMPGGGVKLTLYDYLQGSIGIPRMYGNSKVMKLLMTHWNSHTPLEIKVVQEFQ